MGSSLAPIQLSLPLCLEGSPYVDLVVDLSLQKRPLQRPVRGLLRCERCVRVLKKHRLLVLEAQLLRGDAEVLGLQLPETTR